MLAHHWVDIDPIVAGQYPLCGIAGWLPWMLAVTTAGPTWVFWQGLSMDAPQLADTDLFSANAPGSGVINLTTLLYLIFYVTILVLTITHDSTFHPAMLTHTALLSPLIGPMLITDGVPGARSTLTDGVVVAVVPTLTCGVYPQASRRVHITLRFRGRAPGEHVWFKRQKRATMG